MKPGDDTAEEIRRLLSQRADVMAMLVDEPSRKRDLTDALDVSRSTVDRAVRQLETNDLVRREQGTVVATVGGRLAYESYCQHCAETERIATFGDILAAIPASAELDHELLDGAAAYRSEPPATGRPANEITALISRGVGMRACASAINDSAAAEQFYRMITERGGHGSVVYASSLADHVREEYFDTHHEMAMTGRFHAYGTEQLPYELFLIDDERTTTVAVLVYGETETLRGAIVNDSDTAVRWGEETFERYRREATEFTDDFRVGDDAAATGDDAGDGPGG